MTGYNNDKAYVSQPADCSSIGVTMPIARHGERTAIKPGVSSSGSAENNKQQGQDLLAGRRTQSLPRKDVADFRRLSCVNAFAAKREGWGKEPAWPADEYRPRCLILLDSLLDIRGRWNSCERSSRRHDGSDC